MQGVYRFLLMIAIVHTQMCVESRVANTILYMETQINLTQHTETRVNVFRQWTLLCKSEMSWPFFTFGFQDVSINMFYDWSSTRHTVKLFCIGYDWRGHAENTIACPGFVWSPPVLYAPRRESALADVTNPCAAFLQHHPRLVGAYVHKYINTNTSVSTPELAELSNSTRTSVEMDGVMKVEFYTTSTVEYTSRLTHPAEEMRCRVGFYFYNRQCVQCPENHTTAIGYTPEKQASCVCIAGYTRAGDFQCMPCQAGLYSDKVDTLCRSCAPGTFSSRKGQVFCEDCAERWIAELPGAAMCTPCLFSTNSNADHTACVSYHFQILHGLGIFLGVVIILVGVQVLYCLGVRCVCRVV